MTTPTNEEIAEMDRQEEAARMASQRSATAGELQEEPVSAIPQVAQVQALLKEIAELPDVKDGLDLRQFKRQAIAQGQNFKNQLTAVLKLAS